MTIPVRTMVHVCQYILDGTTTCVNANQDLLGVHAKQVNHYNTLVYSVWKLRKFVYFFSAHGNFIISFFSLGKN